MLHSIISGGGQGAHWVWKVTVWRQWERSSAQRCGKRCASRGPSRASGLSRCISRPAAAAQPRQTSRTTRTYDGGMCPHTLRRMSSGTSAHGDAVPSSSSLLLASQQRTPPICCAGTIAVSSAALAPTGCESDLHALSDCGCGLLVLSVAGSAGLLSSALAEAACSRSCRQACMRAAVYGSGPKGCEEVTEVPGSSRMQLLAQLPRSCRYCAPVSSSTSEEAEGSASDTLKQRPLPVLALRWKGIVKCAGESGGEQGLDDGSPSLCACCGRGNGSSASTEDVRNAVMLSCNTDGVLLGYPWKPEC